MVHKRFLLSMAAVLAVALPDSRAQMAPYPVYLKEGIEKSKAGNLDQADELFEKAVQAAAEQEKPEAEIKEKLYAPVWQEYKNHGVEFARKRQFRQSEQWLKKACAVARKFGDGDPRQVLSFYDLYTVYLDQYKLSPAMRARAELTKAYDLMVPVQQAKLKDSLAELKAQLPETINPEISRCVGDLGLLGRTVVANLKLKQPDVARQLVEEHLVAVNDDEEIGEPFKSELVNIYREMLTLIDDSELKTEIKNKLDSPEDEERIEAMKDASSGNFDWTGFDGVNYWN